MKEGKQKIGYTEAGWNQQVWSVRDSTGQLPAYALYSSCWTRDAASCALYSANCYRSMSYAASMAFLSVSVLKLIPMALLWYFSLGVFPPSAACLIETELLASNRILLETSLLPWFYSK